MLNENLESISGDVKKLGSEMRKLEERFAVMHDQQKDLVIAIHKLNFNLSKKIELILKRFDTDTMYNRTSIRRLEENVGLEPIPMEDFWASQQVN